MNVLRHHEAPGCFFCFNVMTSLRHPTKFHGQLSSFRHFRQGGKFPPPHGRSVGLEPMRGRVKDFLGYSQLKYSDCVKQRDIRFQLGFLNATSWAEESLFLRCRRFCQKKNRFPTPNRCISRFLSYIFLNFLLIFNVNSPFPVILVLFFTTSGPLVPY